MNPGFRNPPISFPFTYASYTPRPVVRQTAFVIRFAFTNRFTNAELSQASPPAGGRSVEMKTAPSPLSIAILGLTAR